jgi:predicted Zn finger-like uncharacterized protein
MSNSEDIVTRCPQCNTAFRVTLNQLAVADGQVRCGSCLAVFKAVDHDAKNDAGSNTTSTQQKKSEQAAVEKEPSITPTNTASEATFSKVVLDTAKEPSSSQPASTNNDGLKITTREPDEKQPHPQTPQEEKVAAADLDDVLIADDNDNKKLDLDGDIFDLGSENSNNQTSLFDRKLNEVKEHRRESADESWAVRMLAELEDEENEGRAHFITEPKLKPTSVKNNNVVNNNDELSDDCEVKTDAEQSSDYSHIDLDIDTGDTGDTSDTNYDSDLYSDQDAIGNEGEDLGSDSKPSAVDNIKDAEAFEHHRSISDEEIEHAISSPTHYQDDPKNYLANIEPAPVEMMDFSSPSAQRWLWRAGAIIVGLLLLLQIAIIRFDTLSKHPSYRSLYSSACKIIGCTLPLLIDTQQIRTTNLIVRSHPLQQNALIIDAILINNAKFSQEFPALQLVFSDINDQLVASRQLQPDEYLRGELAGAKQMANNQPIQLSIEIVDPGDRAVNYQLTVVQARPQR